MTIQNRFFSPRLPNSGSRQAVLGQAASAFDFIIRTRQDLVNAVGAPAGGQFTLLSGSYALSSGFSIPESVLLPAGVGAYIQGMGPEKLVTFENGFYVEGVLRALGLQLTAVNSPVLTTALSAIVQLNQSSLSAVGQAGLSIGDGTFVETVDCDVATSGSAAVSAAGNGSLQAYGGSFECTAGANTITTEGNLGLYGVSVVGNENADTIQTALGTVLHIIGGQVISRGAAVGCYLNVNNDYASIQGVDFNNPTLNGSSIGIRIAGPGGEVNIGSGTRIRGTGAGLAAIRHETGISSLNLDGVYCSDEYATSYLFSGGGSPGSQGIQVRGCQLLGATPFNGVAPGDADVFMRANFGAGGTKLTDSPIVP